MGKIKDTIRHWIYNFIDEPNNPIIKRIERQYTQMMGAQSMTEQNMLQIHEDLANIKLSLLSSNKYGTICHNFLQKYYVERTGKDFSDHFVSYHYESLACIANIGDYIQTIATENAIRLCLRKQGKEPIFENVLRSNLTEHQGGTCVMQGWYEHKQLTFLPGRSTRSVWIGTHFSNEARTLLKYLYQYSEIRFDDIGCRDKSTLSFCQSMGIPSYYSRCLTLTLPRRNDTDAKNAKDTYIIDCPPSIIELLPENITKGAIVKTQRDIRHYPWQDWKRSRKLAEQFLEEYRTKARLIITTALHCAQPCLAMGIPVVFINPQYDEEAERFSSMDGLIRQYTIEDIKNNTIDYPVNAPIFEDLKEAILRNLELSLKLHLSESEHIERHKIRKFIANYSIQ